MKLEKLDGHMNHNPSPARISGNEIRGSYVTGWQCVNVRSVWKYWRVEDDGPAHRWVFLSFILKEGN